jgi:hypothetical protein
MNRENNDSEGDARQEHPFHPDTDMKRQARVGDLSSTEGLTPGLNVPSMRGSPAGSGPGPVAGMKVAQL